MTTLIFLISLLATDCRVHRVPVADTVGCEIAVGVVSRMPQGCLTKSHWIDTCKMRCDTVWWYSIWNTQRSDSACYPEVHCYPDTAESDSVPIGIWEWNDLYRDESIRDSMYLLVTAAELADIREMLREWRVEKCYKTALWKWPSVGIFDYEKEAIRDSCRCVYGKEKP